MKPVPIIVEFHPAKHWTEYAPFDSIWQANATLKEYLRKLVR